jgi:hypothetical protein
MVLDQTMILHVPCDEKAGIYFFKLYKRVRTLTEPGEYGP